MKLRLFIPLAILLLTGCATPSKVIERFNNEGNLIERITEYDNSTFYSGKAIGLTIGVNPDTRIPEVILRYGRYESARIHRGMFYDSDYGINDINLITGEGTANHHIKLGPQELHGPIINLKKPPE